MAYCERCCDGLGGVDECECGLGDLSDKYNDLQAKNNELEKELQSLDKLLHLLASLTGNWYKLTK